MPVNSCSLGSKTDRHTDTLQIANTSRYHVRLRRLSLSNVIFLAFTIFLLPLHSNRASYVMTDMREGFKHISLPANASTHNVRLPQLEELAKGLNLNYCGTAGAGADGRLIGVGGRIVTKQGSVSA